MAGTEFALNEKYPQSFRLDHPNFGDVHLTSYAKGVIKEVKKISDDPLKMQSLVKVEIEGKGESDFIPLFYHPKKQYWDDEEEGIQAQDFNAGQKYFEQAWQSFRGDDEVRVMLREDKPYAVVGFNDGKPRLGENIAKIEYQSRLYQPHFFHWRADKRYLFGEFDEEKNGPDDKELRLTEECPKQLVWSKTVYGVPDPPIGGWVHHLASVVYYYYHEWAVPIGPTLWLFQVLSTYWSKTMDYKEYTGEPPAVTIDETTDQIETHAIIIQAGPFSKEFYERTGVANQVGDPFEAHLADQRWFNEYPDFTVQKEFPGEELSLGYVESNASGGLSTDSRLKQDHCDWFDGVQVGGAFPYTGNPTHSDPWIYPDEIMSSYWPKFVPRWETAKFFVRPHNPEN